MPIIQDVVLRQVEDIAHLWQRRRSVLQTNQLTHHERVAFESRLEANIEGASLAGEAALDTAFELLEPSQTSGAVFATIVLGGSRLESVPRALARVNGEEDALAAIVSAIGWHALVDVEPTLNSWLNASEPDLALLAMRGLAAHRRSSGPQLGRALASDTPPLRRAAAKALGDLGDSRHAPRLAELLADADAGVRFEASRALARFENPPDAVYELLLTATAGGGRRAEVAAATLVHLVPDQGLALFRRWGQTAGSRRAALAAAEALGLVGVIGSLIDWMNDDVFARSAGEAFRTITGADLAREGLARRRPGHVAGDPTDDPGDANVELIPEYGLPFPDAEKVASWWESSKGNFTSGASYLGGLPIRDNTTGGGGAHRENLRRLVQAAPARHRAIAARALARARPGFPTIETDAFATVGHVLPGWTAYE